MLWACSTPCMLMWLSMCSLWAVSSYSMSRWPIQVAVDNCPHTGFLACMAMWSTFAIQNSSNFVMHWSLAEFVHFEQDTVLHASFRFVGVTLSPQVLAFVTLLPLCLVLRWVWYAHCLQFVRSVYALTLWCINDTLFMSDFAIDLGSAWDDSRASWKHVSPWKREIRGNKFMTWL